MPSSASPRSAPNATVSVTQNTPSKSTAGPHQVANGIPALAHGHLLQRHHKGRVVRQPGRGERLLISGETEPGHAHLPGRLAAEHDHAPAATRDQVGGRRLGALDVRHGDVIHRPMEDALTEYDNRVVDVEQVGVGGVQPDDAQDEPVVEPVPGHRERVEFVAPRPAGLLDGHPETVAGRFLDDERRELAVVGPVDLGNREPDHPRPSGPEVPGGHVDPVVEPGDGLEDLLPRLRPDVRVVVDDVRHRHRGHSGRLRDFLYRYQISSTR
jgi:hypothetical protein